MSPRAVGAAKIRATVFDHLEPPLRATVENTKRPRAAARATLKPDKFQLSSAKSREQFTRPS
jgi:hypothetical protein